MYIFIYEDLTFEKVKKVCEDDLKSVIEGVLDIININSPSCPLYFDGKGWEPIEER